MTLIANTSRTVNVRQILLYALVYAVLIALALLTLAPFLWGISTSLKARSEIFTYPPQWIPNPIHWENYITCNVKSKVG